MAPSGPGRFVKSRFQGRRECAKPTRKKPAPPSGGTRDQYDTVFRQVFEPQALQALPLRATRSFDEFALLLPGVARAPGAGTSTGPGISPDVGTPGPFSVYGLRSRENDFTIDGTDNNDEETGVRRQGFVLTDPQAVESVAELQVLPGLYGAQFGRAIGAQVNAVSRSAAAGFHGTIYGFLTDQRWNAHDFFDAPARAGAPGAIGAESPVNRYVPFTRYMSGASGGGPIRGSSTFLLVSWEQDATHASRQSHFAVPTAAQRGFPEGLPVPGSLYPSTLVGDAIFSFYPFPNNPTGPYGANTYTAVLPADQSGDLFAVRLDNHFRAARLSNVLSLRYNRAGEQSTLPVTGGALISSMRPQVESQSVAALLTTNFGSSFANTLRSSWGNALYRFQPAGDFSSGQPEGEPFLLNRPLMLNLTVDPAQPQFVAANYSNPLLAGIVAGNGPVYTEAITGPVGQIQLGGFSGVGVDSYHFPQRRSDGTFQVADTVSTIRKKHMLTVGFEFWYIRLNSDLNRNAAPIISFYGQRNAASAYPIGGLLPLSNDWLSATDLVAAGVPGMIYQTVTTSTDSNLGLDRKQADFFLQDDIRAKPGLDFSLGVRFRYGLLAQRNFNRTLFQSQLAQAYQSCSGLVNSIVNLQLPCNTFTGNLASAYSPQVSDGRPFLPDPRSGISWSPDGRTVLRAGAGMYSGQFPAIVLNEERSAFPVYAPLAVRPLSPSPTTLYRLPVQGSLNGMTTSNPFSYLMELQGTASAVLNNVDSAPGTQAPYSEQYALTLERTIGNVTVSTGYVGTRGLHLLKDFPNAPLAQTYISILPAQQVGSGMFPDFSARYYPMLESPSVISDLYFSSSGRSRYDSLQTQFNVQSRWIHLGWAFTWSHARDDASDFFDTASSFALPQDPLHPSEWASSDFDVRIRSVTHFVADSPWRNWLARGWKLAGIVSLETGQPFTANTSYDVNQDGWLTDRIATTAGLTGPGMGLPSTGDSRAQLAFKPGVTSEDLLSPASLIQAEQFGYCLEQVGAAETEVCDGAVGRNSFRSASQQTFDAALSRSLAITERTRAVFRVEAYNALNRVNFGVPVRILESPAFGKAVTTASPNRLLQFAVKITF